MIHRNETERIQISLPVSDSRSSPQQINKIFIYAHGSNYFSVWGVEAWVPSQNVKASGTQVDFGALYLEISV